VKTLFSTLPMLVWLTLAAAQTTAQSGAPEEARREVRRLAALQAAHLVPKRAEHVKVIASGTLDKPVTVSGLKVTPGARKIIEAAGGKVELWLARGGA